MSYGKRIGNILGGVVMLFSAVAMIVFPDDLGYGMIALILSVTLFIMGVSSLIYYFRMARHMVGGRIMLYKGVILFDLAMFTMTMTNFPKLYIIIYLVIYHAFAGVVEVLHSRETKAAGAPQWKMEMSRGVVNIMVAISCVAFLHWPNVIVYIYSVGLAYSAITQILSSFKRTAVVYIQ